MQWGIRRRSRGWAVAGVFLLLAALSTRSAPAEASTLPLEIVEQVEVPARSSTATEPTEIRMTVENTGERTIVAWKITGLVAAHEGVGGTWSISEDAYVFFPPDTPPIDEPSSTAIHPGESRTFHFPRASVTVGGPYGALAIEVSVVFFDDGTYLGEPLAAESIYAGRAQRAQAARDLLGWVESLLATDLRQAHVTAELTRQAEVGAGQIYASNLHSARAGVLEGRRSTIEVLEQLRQMFADDLRTAEAHLPAGWWDGESR